MKNPELIAFLLGHFEFPRPGAFVHLLCGQRFPRRDLVEALRFLERTECIRRTYVRDASGSTYSAPLIELTDAGRALLASLQALGLPMDRCSK